MRRTLRSELRKLQWTRSAWAVPVAGVVISVVAAAALSFAIGVDEQAGRLSGHGPLRFGASNLGLLLLLHGVRTFGDEVQHRTLAATYAVVPDRRRILAAKVLVLAGVTVAVCAAIYLLVVPMAIVASAARDLGMVLDAGATVALFARATAAMTLFALLGVAVAVIAGNRTVALVGCVLWLALGETIVGGLTRRPEWMPGSLLESLVTGSSPGSAAGGIALLGLVAVALGGATVALRRDIP